VTLGRTTPTRADFDRLDQATTWPGASSACRARRRTMVVQRGPHADLVQQDGVYAALHASWMSQSR